MAKGGLELRSVRSRQELQEANDLMAKVFARDYFDTIEWMRHIGAAYPGFQPEYTRIAIADGEIAGALRLTSDTLRLGEARLHMGGFGWIATAPHHRNKGVASALIGDTMHYMRDHMFHVAMLFGIPNFYHRFGFHTTLAEYTTRVDIRDLPPYEGPAFRVRQAKPGDVRLLQKMHEQADTQTACSIIRCGAHFHYHWQRWESAQVVLSPDGKVLAYFLPNRKKGLFLTKPSRSVEVEECGVINRTACQPLMQAIADFAREMLLPEVRFHGPPGHPLIEFLCKFRSTHTMQLSPGEGGMMAVVNPAETLESMLPEWESRIAQMGERELKTELTLLIDRVPLLVRCHHGAISILRQTGPNKLSLTQEEFVQLLTGYRHLAEVLASRRRIINQSALTLAEAIFPKRHPYVWRADRF
jgi:predicted acetyltransferase